MCFYLMGAPFTPSLSSEDLALALRHAPIIRFDRREPFLPSYVGVSIFYSSGKSPSFPRVVKVAPPAVCCIEYAIWWDWDIQHLYELEHVWVYLNHEEIVVGVEGSWHGLLRRFPRWEEVNGHPILYSQPGKHAFAASPRDFPRLRTTLACTLLAGNMGLLIKDMFANVLSELKSKDVDRLISAYLRKFAFIPSFDFDKEIHFPPEAFVSWDDLRSYIPVRIKTVILELMEIKKEC